MIAPLLIGRRGNDCHDDKFEGIAITTGHSRNSYAAAKPAPASEKIAPPCLANPKFDEVKTT